MANAGETSINVRVSSTERQRAETLAADDKRDLSSWLRKTIDVQWAEREARLTRAKSDKAIAEFTGEHVRRQG